MKGGMVVVALACALWASAAVYGAVNKKESAALPLPVGVVEGFYGRPWTHEERLAIIRFLGEMGLNSYCYAPKDDPYHRKEWREPYPEAEFQKLLELVRACRRAKVTFCFAISPGLDIEYSNPADLALLLKKLELLNKAGVQSFALFFDDVPSTFRHESDAKAFPSFAAAHAKLANDVYAQLKQWNSNASLIVCPTEYYHSDPTPYLTELGSKLHPDIPIIWTGRGVCSPTIDAPDLLRIRTVLGRKPFIWDNYPVNDYDEGHIYLGPIRHRTPLMGLNVAGYWSNPMNESELSKIPLMTIADFYRSPETYNPENSWRRALQRIGGNRAYPYLLRLSDLMMGSFLTRDEARVLCTLVADYFENPTPATVGSLREYLQQLLELEPNLERTLTNRRLFEELRPSLKRLRLHVRNLQTAIRLAELPSTSTEAAALREALRKGLAAVDTPVTAPAMGSPEWERLLRDDFTVFPGNIADEIFAQIQQTFHSKWTQETSPTLPRLLAAPPSVSGCFGEHAIDGDSATAYRSRNSWKSGDYLAVDFRDTLVTRTMLRISMIGVEKWKQIFYPRLEIETSKNGAQWDPVGITQGAVTEVVLARPCRFVRLLAARDTDAAVAIREITPIAPEITTKSP
ncbi:MAG: protein O-GlcNAcase [Candidatus Sumerlaeaceae bacterium]|nr:protein O-GlcNAcase [Candidatus Sumerlaeaceae bacterium]